MDDIRKITIKTTEGIDNLPYGIFKEYTLKNGIVIDTKIITPTIKK